MSHSDRRRILAALGIFAVLLTACVSAAYHKAQSPEYTPPAAGYAQDVSISASGAMSTAEMTGRLQVGMQPDSVLSALGPPGKVQRDVGGGGAEQYWYYRGSDGLLQLHFTQDNLTDYHTY